MDEKSPEGPLKVIYCLNFLFNKLKGRKDLSEGSDSAGIVFALGPPQLGRFTGIARAFCVYFWERTKWDGKPSRRNAIFIGVSGGGKGKNGKTETLYETPVAQINSPRRLVLINISYIFLRGISPEFAL